MSAEHPILFAGPLVRAILDGRKTETRRVARLPNDWADGPVSVVRDHRGALAQRKPGGAVVRCPYGQPGDLLYVRETWAPNEVGDDIVFRAGHGECSGLYLFDVKTGTGVTRVTRWRPSIHMFKRFARIWLRVEDVRVERVQDIDDEAALREGMEGHPVDGHAGYPIGYAPRDEFRDLWDSINAERGFGWGVNPWVWVVRFSVASTTGRRAVEERAA